MSGVDGIPPTSANVSTHSDINPLVTERFNLMAAGKLVIRELIDMALRSGRNIPENNPTLVRFLIILERIVCHGLKPRRALFGEKVCDPWLMIENLPRVRPESADIVRSVQQMSDIKSGLGRTRVWLRMALMEKTLGDCFRALVENREVLRMDEHYHLAAFIGEEEGTIFAGLLIGLNVIDCNFAIRDSLPTLEEPLGIVDYARYIKKELESDSSPVGTETEGEMALILDQKSYLEELNQRLKSQVDSLEKKCKFAFDALMKTKEEMAIMKDQASILTEANELLRAEKESLTMALDRHKETSQSDLQVERETYQVSRAGLDAICLDLQSKLREEAQMRLDIENELKKQIAMKSEAECALQLLENHVHQKQDTIVGLRAQIEEVKALNLEQYDKMQRTQRTVTDNTASIKLLEEQLNEVQDENSELRVRLTTVGEHKIAAEEASRRLGQQFASCESRRSELETDLRLERERRVSAVRESEAAKQKVVNLTRELERMKATEKSLKLAIEEKAEIERRCNEQEETLQEMADVVQRSKMETDMLRENQLVQQDKQWTSDKTVKNCMQCNRIFSVTLRRHHCRNCGDIFCGECSDNKMPLPSSQKPVRVCDTCNTQLLQRFTARQS